MVIIHIVAEGSDWDIALCGESHPENYASVEELKEIPIVPLDERICKRCMKTSTYALLLLKQLAELTNDS